MTTIYTDNYPGPHQTRHEVAGVVPFTEGEVWLTAGDETLQIRDPVLFDNWIRILVNHHHGSCVGDEDIGKAILNDRALSTRESPEL
jgi:hypothetical protein